MNTKYLIIGAGAIGGILTAILTKSGKDVTLIARGNNYEIIKKHGLHVVTLDDEYNINVNVKRWDEYNETPDIIIICIKAYSTGEIIGELDRICNESTIIIPIMNTLDIGSTIEAKMNTKCTITGGVVDVNVMREKIGNISQTSDYFSIMVGMRNNESIKEELNQVKNDFEEVEIKFIIKNNPIKSAIRKFLRVSTFSAVCCYYETTVGGVREKEGGIQLFKDLCNELVQIANNMGDPFGVEDEEPFPGTPVEVEAVNYFLNIEPEYQTSMKFDWDKNNRTEIKQQILDVIDLGEKYGVPMGAYRKVARKLIELKPELVSPEDREKYCK